MKKRMMYLLTTLLLCGSLWPAEVTVNNGAATFANSGDVALYSNTTGAYGATFEIIVTGGPATLSIPVQGCGKGGNCHAAVGTYVVTSSGLMSVTFDAPYDVWKITPTWTGGTSVTIKVNITSSIANSHTGGGGASTNPTSGTIPVKSGAAFVDSSINCSPASAAGSCTIQPTADVPALIVHGFPGGVADVLQVQIGSGPKTFWIDASGSLKYTSVTQSLGDGTNAIAASLSLFGSQAGGNAGAPWIKGVPSPSATGIPSYLFPCASGSTWGVSNNAVPSADCTGVQKIQTGMDNGRRTVQCVPDSNNGVTVCAPGYTVTVSGAQSVPAATSALLAASFTTGAVAQNQAGMLLNFNSWAFGSGMYYHARVALPSITDERVWIGMSGASIGSMISDQVAGSDYAMFHHCKETSPTNCATAGSSLTAQTTNWQCVTHTAAGLYTAVDSGVAVGTALVDLEIIENGANASYTFLINGGSVCGSPVSTTLPTNSAQMFPQLSVTTQIAGAKVIKAERIFLSANH